MVDMSCVVDDDPRIIIVTSRMCICMVPLGFLFTDCILGCVVRPTILRTHDLDVFRIGGLWADLPAWQTVQNRPADFTIQVRLSADLMVYYSTSRFIRSY
jgi:hypothetical protein